MFVEHYEGSAFTTLSCYISPVGLAIMSDLSKSRYLSSLSRRGFAKGRAINPSTTVAGPSPSLVLNRHGSSPSLSSFSSRERDYHR